MENRSKSISRVRFICILCAFLGCMYNMSSRLGGNTETKYDNSVDCGYSSYRADLIRNQFYTGSKLIKIHRNLIATSDIPESKTLEVSSNIEISTEENNNNKEDRCECSELDDETIEFIKHECNSRKVPYKLILAMIKTESNFNPNLISNTGDFGLMQINKINHKGLSAKLGITNFLDPKQNIKAGVYMVSEILGDYPEYNKALMVYNNGYVGAKELWKRGKYSSKYSKKVISNIKNL